MEKDYDTVALVHYGYGLGKFSMLAMSEDNPGREVIIRMPDDAATAIRLVLALLGHIGDLHGINVENLMKSLMGIPNDWNNAIGTPDGD